MRIDCERQASGAHVIENRAEPCGPHVDGPKAHVRATVVKEECWPGCWRLAQRPCMTRRRTDEPWCFAQTDLPP